MIAIDGQMIDPIGTIDKRYASMDDAMGNPSADVSSVISADRRREIQPKAVRVPALVSRTAF
jgi:hypothetical protein